MKKINMDPKEKWNELYNKEGYRYGTEPIHLLKHQWQRLRKGHVLDLAMGEGRNAVFLAEKGFQVTGFDFSTVAVEKAKKLAYEKEVKIEVKSVDLDLYVFKLFSFDSILLSYFKPIPRYYDEVHRALVQGGVVVFESFTTEQLLTDPIQGFENQDYYHPNELLKNLSKFQILFYNEDRIDEKYIVQCIAKKASDRDAVKYGFSKPEEGKNEQDARFKVAEDLFKKKHR